MKDMVARPLPCAMLGFSWLGCNILLAKAVEEVNT